MTYHICKTAGSVMHCCNFKLRFIDSKIFAMQFCICSMSIMLLLIFTCHVCQDFDWFVVFYCKVVICFYVQSLLNISDDPHGLWVKDSMGHTESFWVTHCHLCMWVSFPELICRFAYHYKDIDICFILSRGFPKRLNVMEQLLVRKFIDSFFENDLVGLHFKWMF